MDLYIGTAPKAGGMKHKTGGGGIGSVGMGKNRQEQHLGSFVSLN